MCHKCGVSTAVDNGHRSNERKSPAACGGYRLKASGLKQSYYQYRKDNLENPPDNVLIEIVVAEGIARTLRVRRSRPMYTPSSSTGRV
jgi:hypothetical protein